MNSIRIIYNYNKMRLSSFFFSQKSLVMLIYIFLIFVERFSGLKLLIENLGYNISIYSYPHLLASGFMRFLITIGALILFMDAPFMDNLVWTLMSKMKKKLWIISNVVYIFIMSVIYTITLNIAILISLIGHQTFIPDWGKIMYTLARNKILNEEYGIRIFYNTTLMDRYTPLEAMEYSISLSILQFMIIGLIIMSISLFFKTNWIGVLSTCIYILSENYVSLAGDLNFDRFLPVTYLDITSLELVKSHWSMTVSSAYLILFLIIVTLSLISYFRIKSMDIDVYKELE